MTAMQRATFHRFSQISGIIAAILLVLLLFGTDTGRAAFAWIYFKSTDAIANGTHIQKVPLDRLDPTCPQCM